MNLDGYLDGYLNDTWLINGQVGARCLETSILGAHDNVMINLSDVSDVEFRSETERQVKTLVATARRQCQSVLDILDERQR